jgi:hypothetical protein
MLKKPKAPTRLKPGWRFRLFWFSAGVIVGTMLALDGLGDW